MVIIKIRKQLHGIRVLLTEADHALLQRFGVLLTHRLVQLIINEELPLRLAVEPTFGINRLLLQENRHVVLDQNLDGHLPGVLAHQIRFLHLQLLPLGLVAPVLVPDLHLGLGQLESLGQIGPFRSAQVTLLAETALQFEDLSVRERGARSLLAVGLAGVAHRIVRLAGRCVARRDRRHARQRF